MTPELNTIDFEVIITKKQLQKEILKLAEKINTDYEGESVVIIGTLYGAKRFAEELRKLLIIPHEYDEIRVSTYKGAVSSVEQGFIKHIKDLEIDIKDKHVIIIEDTMETGFSALYMMYNLGLQQPTSLKICTLIDKPQARKPWISVIPDYCCFTLPERPMTVGFGMDYKGHFRERDDVIKLGKLFLEKNEKGH